MRKSLTKNIAKEKKILKKNLNNLAPTYQFLSFSQ